MEQLLEDHIHKQAAQDMKLLSCIECYKQLLAKERKDYMRMTQWYLEGGADSSTRAKILLFLRTFVQRFPALASLAEKQDTLPFHVTIPATKIDVKIDIPIYVAPLVFILQQSAVVPTPKACGKRKRPSTATKIKKKK